MCGYSPRMRLDVSVNLLTFQALKNNQITVFGGQQTRPNIHIMDIVNVYRHFLKNKNIQNIIYAQKKATENVFTKKNIPFRSFEIKKRDEKTLGELFTFFILETILLGKVLKLNPYDQPAVELIKTETKKILS